MNTPEHKQYNKHARTQTIQLTLQNTNNAINTTEQVTGIPDPVEISKFV